MKISPSSLTNLPIRYKFNFLALFTTGLALCVAFLAMTISAERQFENSMKRELQSLAAVIGQAAEASLVFNDTASAERFVTALKVKENIIAAAVASADGTVLASYTRSDAAPIHFGNPSPAPGVECNTSACSAVYPIQTDAAGSGVIYLVSDLRALNLQLRENAKILCLTFIISFGVALVVASVLERIISRPLLELASLTKRVSSQNDYSLRIPDAGQESPANEIGILIRGFNYMLEQIQKRDIDLTFAKDAAVEANRAKSEFVANTSHEIRTPINNIIGFTEMLAEQAEEPDEKRYIELIKSSAESLLGIINDILDISKIEAGRLELSPHLTDLKEYVRYILSPIEAHAKKKGLDFVVQLDDSLPAEVAIDAGRFCQVLVNLSNNAIKFTEAPGRICAELQCFSGPGTGPMLRVKVSDTGIGIPPAAQASIFEAFRQADASTTRKYGGTGLGLAISQKIVTLMGGSIQLESEVGKGSCFSFEIPLSLRLPETQEAAAAQSLAPQQERQSAAVPQDPAQLQILVVEDNPMSREITVHRLKKLGFQVSIAENGQQAVTIAQERAFDLILMDCQMPEMDGFEATALIRNAEASKSARCAIVALTAHAMDGYRDQCIEAGMNDYLTKPIKERELNAFFERFHLTK
jgi:signal transduction histidine kinase/ActR/RegA family two-component response regulator